MGAFEFFLPENFGDVWRMGTTIREKTDLLLLRAGEYRQSSRITLLLSKRLLTAGSLVRVRPEEPIATMS